MSNSLLLAIIIIINKDMKNALTVVKLLSDIFLVKRMMFYPLQIFNPLSSVYTC